MELDELITQIETIENNFKLKVIDVVSKINTTIDDDVLNMIAERLSINISPNSRFRIKVCPNELIDILTNICVKIDGTVDKLIKDFQEEIL